MEEDSSNDIIESNSISWRIFNAHINKNEETEVNDDEILDYIKKELKLNLDHIPAIIKNSLTEIVLAYASSWSGWHSNAKLPISNLKTNFLHFRKFLTNKISTVLTESLYKDIVKAVTNEIEAKSNMTKSDFAPYAISVECPPSMLNTIAFSIIGDDVILKPHLGLPWVKLSTVQLVNWPHVEVTFKSQDLFFVRGQATEFVCYLNFWSHQIRKKIDPIVESLQFLPVEDAERECFSFDYLEFYIKEYIMALKTIINITGSKLEEIYTILQQFLEDVKYINIDKKIATYTRILFCLRNIPFMRNKKLINKGKEVRVGYCEIVTPKVDLSLLKFEPAQMNTNPVSFIHCETIRYNNNNGALFLPDIYYKCTFCNVEFRSLNAKKMILNHLECEHKMEQSVTCSICKKKFDVLYLALHRWKHKCPTMYNNDNVSNVSS